MTTMRSLLDIKGRKASERQTDRRTEDAKPIHDRFQAVSNCENRAIPVLSANGTLNERICASERAVQKEVHERNLELQPTRLQIHACRRLIDAEDPRFSQQHARQRQKLTLPYRKILASFRHYGVRHIIK
jgi:hypothetical protein